MQRDIEYKIAWIPAHKGIKGNAEQLANTATALGQQQRYKIPGTDLLANSKKWIVGRWEELWTSKVKYKKTALATVKSKLGTPWFQN